MMAPLNLDVYMTEIAQAKSWADEPGVGPIVMDALETAELLVAELRAAREVIEAVLADTNDVSMRVDIALDNYEKATQDGGA